MKNYTYSYTCDKCKNPIEGDVYRIFAGKVNPQTDEVDDDGGFYLDNTGEVELCEGCLKQVDELIVKSMRYKKCSNNSRGRKKVELDMNEIIEMRNNNVSLDNIANKFGCSPQTIQNHLIKIGYYKTNDQGEIVL